MSIIISVHVVDIITITTRLQSTNITIGMHVVVIITTTARLEATKGRIITLNMIIVRVLIINCLMSIVSFN